jgi:hypothetical protein
VRRFYAPEQQIGRRISLIGRQLAVAEGLQ